MCGHCFDKSFASESGEKRRGLFFGKVCSGKCREEVFERKYYLRYNKAILRSTECCVHEWHPPISAKTTVKEKSLFIKKNLGVSRTFLFCLFCQLAPIKHSIKQLLGSQKVVKKRGGVNPPQFYRLCLEKCSRDTDPVSSSFWYISPSARWSRSRWW